MRVPSPPVFQRLIDRLLVYGTLLPYTGNAGRHMTRISQQQEDDIIAAFLEDEHLSTRLCAVRMGVAQQDVWNVLNNAGLKPYKFQSVQQLLGLQDFNRRDEFARSFLNRIEETLPLNLEDLILWTDECNVTPNGMWNSKNYVTWSDFNPHRVRESKTQFRWTINLWAGIIGSRIVSVRKEFLSHIFT